MLYLLHTIHWMIQDFKEFNLFGKRTFAKAIIRPPFKFAAEMPNEACF